MEADDSLIKKLDEGVGRVVPEQPSLRLRYNLTQDYLEVARAAITQIHGKVPKGEGGAEPPLSPELANAVFSVVSLTIVYSFLTLESFLNYHLFQLWTRRHDGTEEGNRALTELGDVPEFVGLMQQRFHPHLNPPPSRGRRSCFGRLPADEHPNASPCRRGLFSSRFCIRAAAMPVSLADRVTCGRHSTLNTYNSALGTE